MDFDITGYERAGEVLCRYRHGSGLAAFVLPKRGYSRKYAAIAVHYGSTDNEFIVPGEEKPTKVPDGIAHFLEHKLFDRKDGNVMDEFSRLGSSPNAYTGFNQTVYHFSCTDRFEDNFALLLDYVQNPYITDESVEKEKGIIGQEISMYRDNPGWKAFFNLLGALYGRLPVRTEIAGTPESISMIDRETLYKCYNTFYHPSNMSILVVGDVEPDRVFGMVESSLLKKDARPEIIRIYPDEPEGVNRDFVEQKMAVSMPLFQMGYKDSRKDDGGMDMLMHEVAVKLLLEMMIGRSSVLYEQLYGEGLLNSTFETDFTIEKGYAFSLLGGESPDPARVRDRFCMAVEDAKRRGLDRSCFERILKSAMGRYLRQFNSIDRISRLFIPVYFKGVNAFDYLQVYDKITFEYMNEMLEDHFRPENLALSVVGPI